MQRVLHKALHCAAAEFAVKIQAYNRSAPYKRPYLLIRQVSPVLRNGVGGGDRRAKKADKPEKPTEGLRGDLGIHGAGAAKRPHRAKTRKVKTRKVKTRKVRTRKVRLR